MKKFQVIGLGFILWISLMLNKLTGEELDLELQYQQLLSDLIEDTVETAPEVQQALDLLLAKTPEALAMEFISQLKVGLQYQNSGVQSPVFSFVEGQINQSVEQILASHLNESVIDESVKDELEADQSVTNPKDLALALGLKLYKDWLLPDDFLVNLSKFLSTNQSPSQIAD